MDRRSGEGGKARRARGGIGAAFALAAAMTSTGAGAASAEEAAPAGGVLAETGRDLYVRHCASCHGVDGRGAGPVAESLRKPPADLTRISARRGGAFPAGEIASIVDGRFDIRSHGPREMPIWGERLGEPIAEGTTADEVARGRIDALVAFLQTIQR